MLINPTSLSVNQLFSSNEQYVIPAYQRRYSWHERQVGELLDDIRLIENGDTHLLGGIVCLVGPHEAGLNRLELVDGQQRLTTISILLECIRQRLEQENDQEAHEEAREVSRMLRAKTSQGKIVRKIALDSIDADEFDEHLQGDSEKPFQNRDLEAAFNKVRGWISSRSIEKIRSFLDRLRHQSIFIRLDVSSAKDAFKLFETINNRGLPLSLTDIIKNFLLGNAARFGSDKLRIARTSWSELIAHLDGTNTDAFFRYYLMAMLKARVTAGEVVPQFKKLFMSQVSEAATLPETHLYSDVPEPDFEEVEQVASIAESEIKVTRTGKLPFKKFLAQLTNYAKIYGELVLAKTDNKKIDRHLENLRMIKAVQTYGFLTYLRVNGCTDKRFNEILNLTESFVLRRHVCRERANETEALFARLCDVDLENPIKQTKEAYRDLCPTDEKFRQEFANTDFSANLIDRARYCLSRIEAATHGAYDELQVLGADDVHVEHIIPQKIKSTKAKVDFGDWVDYLGANAEAQHQRYVSRIGNLTLFAGELNIGASNNPFARKKQAYKESSILLTRELTQLQHFKFKDVERRSNDLAAVAVTLWPLP